MSRLTSGDVASSGRICRSRFWQRRREECGLNEQNLVRKSELHAARQVRIENISENATAEAAIRQTDARIAGLANRIEELRSKTRAEALERRAEALRKVAGLEQQIKREERRQADRQLRAPVAGTIMALSVHTVGGVVTTKDVLMRIVAVGSRQEIECTVLNQDIGFVEKGQPVEIKIETFPFTRYGLVKVTVKQVWHDAIPDETKGLVYKAEVTLDEDKILVGEKWIALAPGMAVQAEINTGERRLISYFLSPLLRYRDESLRER